jgi:flagellar biosynthesis protein
MNAGDPTERQRRAVALRYRDEVDQAPRVLAKGQGSIADRIIALAQEHNVPLHEDQDLIKLLIALDINEEVPPDLYRALAEILSLLYRANREG